MLRLFGIGLISVVLTIWGEKIVKRQKKRIKSLEALLRLFESFEAKVRSFHSPLRQFLLEYKDELIEKSGFLEIANINTDISEIVRSSADELCLDTSDFELISEFCMGLGQYSVDEELKRCDYYIGRMKNILDEAKSKLPGEAKLLRSVGIMSGILAAVFLI